MKTTMSVAFLLAFAASSAYADQPAGGRSRGGHPSGVRPGGRHHSGGRVSGGHVSARPSPRSYVRGRAVPRGSGRSVRSGFQYRHPRVGRGTGHSRVRGFGYGYRSYSRRHAYGNRDYRSYRGYRSYGYSSLGWAGPSLSFYYSSGYPYYSGDPYAGGYVAPYDAGYVLDEDYDGRASERDEAYADRGDRYEDETADAELRLLVLPDDASVWIDGEFQGTARELERLALSPGRHQVEVVRPGFRTAVREVDVRRGAPASLRIELDRP